MAANHITPKDRFYGLPLPIAPNLEELPTDRNEIADWHHHFHRASHPNLQSLGGVALRNSRLQLVDRRLHNEGPNAYHRFYDGPKIPSSEREQFRLVVLACAGFLPRRGIDLSRGEPRKVWLSRDQLALLSTPDKHEPYSYRYLRYNYEPVREFLVSYALTRRLRHAGSLVDEFLHTTDEARRRRLGRRLLAERVEAATEVVGQQYTRARRAGFLHPLMPQTVREFVLDKFGRQQRQEDVIFPRLAAQLLIAHI